MLHLVTNKAPYLLIFFFTISLSACCSPGVKPGEASLFQAGCGVASGQYEEDLNKKQKQVEVSQQKNAIEKNRSLQLDTMLVKSEDQYQQTQQELLKIEGENRQLREKIDTMQVETLKDRELKEKHMEKLQKLNNDIEVLKSRVEENPSDDHMVKLEELKYEVQTLRMIVLGQ